MQAWVNFSIALHRMPVRLTHLNSSIMVSGTHLYVARTTALLKSLGISLCYVLSQDSKHPRSAMVPADDLMMAG